MNVGESVKLRKSMRTMVLDGVNEMNTPSEKDKIEYISSRFKSEMLCNYNRNKNHQKLVKDWLLGLALNVPFYNDDIIDFYEHVLGRELTEKEVEQEIERYWSRLAIIVLKMVGDW